MEGEEDGGYFHYPRDEDELETTEMEGENVTDLTDTSEIETAKCGDQMDMEDIKVGS